MCERVWILLCVCEQRTKHTMAMSQFSVRMSSECWHRSVGTVTNDGLIVFRIRYINDIELRLRSPLEHEQNRWKIVVRNFMKKNDRKHETEQVSEWMRERDTKKRSEQLRERERDREKRKQNVIRLPDLYFIDKWKIAVPLSLFHCRFVVRRIKLVPVPSFNHIFFSCSVLNFLLLFYWPNDSPHTVRYDSAQNDKTPFHP